MPTVNLSSLAGAGQQFFDNNGTPLSGGKLYSYEAGTTTPQASYTDAAGTTPHSNPIILDSAGRVPGGEVWIAAGDNYKFVLKTPTDVQLASWDNITGINGTGITSDAATVSYTPPFTGGQTTTVLEKLAEYVTFQDFGAVGDGIADDSDAVQAAITYASTNRKTIFAYGGFLITKTINFPSNSNGCTILGQSKQTYFKYTTTGAMFASLSTNSIVMRNLTLVGSGSSVAATALSLQTSNPSVGVYYCVFEDLTIEGFKFGISMAGLCEPVFRKVNIGLNKSGIFGGTPQQGSPLIGISIGSTVLAAQFEGLTIFATQRCVSQTTEQQLAEGHYWFGCTFDLSFNDGASSDQACVYYESGQDIVFTACWFTNTQKYGTASTFNDNLLKIAYTPGTINAPLVSLKFNGCNFVGNDMSLQFGSSTTLNRSEIVFCGCVFRIWANFSELVVGGYAQGFSVTGCVFRFYGDPVTVGGVDMYNLPVNIWAISDVSNLVFSSNTFSGILPIHQAPCYVTLGDVSDAIFSGNQFPVTDILTTGDDVRVTGTADNVIVLGSQQSNRRQLSVGITAGTYNGGNPVLASINTQCSKPAMAIVNVYVDDATITNPGATTMLFELEGLAPISINKREVKTTGAQSLDYTFVGIVNGTVNFKVYQSLQAVVGAGTTAKFMTITFI